MISKIRNLIYLGVHKDNSEETNNLLRILNVFSILCIAFASVYYSITLYSKEWISSAIFISAQILLILALVCHKNRKYSWGKFLVYITTNYTILSLFFIYGYDAGFQVYYNTAPLVAFTLYGFKQIKQALAFGLFYVSSYLLIEILSHYEYKPINILDEGFLLLLKEINIALTILLNGVIAYSFSKFHFESNNSLKSSIEDKKVLLAEVHHRVKNNLAIMSSLFNLQIGKSQNQEVIDVLSKNRTRLKSISLLHESLYQQDNVSQINMQSYIEGLVNDIHDSLNDEAKSIKISFDIDNIEIELKRAVPCGILINEILVNSYKYAFKDLDEGVINIMLKEVNNNYFLTIQDSGVGFSRDKVDSTGSLGMELINALTEQLDGELIFNGERGASYQISFPIK